MLKIQDIPFNRGTNRIDRYPWQSSFVQSSSIIICCSIALSLAGWWSFRSYQGALAGMMMSFIAATMYRKYRRLHLLQRCNETAFQWLSQWSDRYSNRAWSDLHTIQHIFEHESTDRWMNYTMVRMKLLFNNGKDWDTIWSVFKEHFPFQDIHDWIEAWFHARTLGTSTRIQDMTSQIGFRMTAQETIRRLLLKSTVELIVLLCVPYVFLILYESIVPQYVQPLFYTATGHLLMATTWIFSFLTVGFLTQGQSHYELFLPIQVKFPQQKKWQRFVRFFRSISPKLFKNVASNPKIDRLVWRSSEITTKLASGMPWMQIFPQQGVVPSLTPHDDWSNDPWCQLIWHDWRQFVQSGDTKLLANTHRNIQSKIKQLLHQSEREAMKRQLLMMIPALLWLLWLCVLLAFPSWLQIQQTWRS